jgi:hypothetical protein
MKAMLTAFVAIAVISVGSYFILGEAGFSAQERTSGAAVRLD